MVPVQVTEREHQRLLSERSAKHREEIKQLRLKLTSGLTDSMEPAQRAEVQQAEVCNNETDPFAVHVVPSWFLEMLKLPLIASRDAISVLAAAALM